VAAGRVEDLAPLLTADRSLSGQAILNRLIAFLCSPEGEQTRTQLFAGLRSGGNGGGGFDLVRLMDLTSWPGGFTPTFGRVRCCVPWGAIFSLKRGNRPATNFWRRAPSGWWLAAGALGRPDTAGSTPRPGRRLARANKKKPCESLEPFGRAFSSNSAEGSQPSLRRASDF